MALFQSTVVQKYLKAQNQTELQAKWEAFQAHFHNPSIQENIRNAKEEQYQEGFLRDLFVTILGYTLNPETNFNLTTELKNVKDAKKADGGILVNKQVIGVIELKGTNTTDLSKVETQAFGYKNNQTHCSYVITSNFEKLRFYIDNAIEHISFNLFELTQDQFNLLYLCLAYPNISKDIPKKIKTESLSQEDAVTKQLYKDYSLFKRVLFNNLVELNPGVDALLLFKKSQKLLDRFLFLFFAEDRHLLPPNSVRMILQQWKQLQELDAYTPLYQRFKKYFGYLNTGHKGKKYDVYPYNGGLFKPDEVLDEVKIDDDVLYEHTLKLSEYDFDSEVDVNILGHIFENSLNEIEEIQEKLSTMGDVSRGHDPLVISKRKKDGVFYTPKYITKYIVENTVGKLCEEQKETLQLVEDDYQLNRKKKTKEKLLQKLKDYRDWLLQLTIVDPACGSGAFLNEALNFLIAEHEYVDELETKLMGGGFVFPNVENSILENNLFGVDINNESVEIAKLSLWLRTAKPNRKLNDLSGNIKCGNSLIDDPEVAGEKAFSWEKEFPQVFQEKDKKIYHITTAIHDSRTSARMKRYKVRERRDGGTNPYPNVIYFTPEDDLLVTKTIAEIVKEDQLKLLAYNICGDHIHMLLACEIDEIPAIMQKIKSITAKKVNAQRNTTRSHDKAEVTRGHDPLRVEENSPLRKEKNKPLWQQKYSAPKEVTTQEQLQNTLSYIKRNRSKHKLPEHSNKIKKIIDEMCCSRDEAFATEYKGGFDVVIGNPPYVNARTMSKVEREWLNNKYEQLTGAWDLYLPFLLKFSNITKNQIYGWIIPNKILISDYAEKSLNYLKIKGLKKAINISTLPIFKNVGVYPIIIIGNNSRDDFNIYEIQKINDLERINDFVKKENKFKRFKTIKDFDIEINSGTTGFEAKKILPLINESDEGIDFAVSGSIDPYIIDMTSVPYMKNKFNNPKVKLDENILANSKINFWKTPKVVIAGMTKRLEAFYSETPLGLGVGIYGIYNFGSFKAKFLLAILNSKFITFYLIKEFKDKHLAGGYLAINKSTIEQLPLIKISNKEQQPFIEKADQMLTLNKDLQKASSKFQRTLQRKFPEELEKLPKKLQDWYTLAFADFIKELKKKKIKLSLAQEAEWEDYFLAEQEKAKSLKAKIDQTDKAIDQMVYELYGLTDEEIEIVEGA